MLQGGQKFLDRVGVCCPYSFVDINAIQVSATLVGRICLRIVEVVNRFLEILDVKVFVPIVPNWKEKKLRFQGR